jgi:hypothetical protein
MKCWLVIIILLPVQAMAQLLELGAAGGIIPYSNYTAAGQPGANWTLSKESQKTSSFGGRAGINFRRMLVGVTCDYQSIMYKSSAQGTAQSFQAANLENDIASSFIAACLYINRGFQLPAGYIYLGVSGGYAVSNMSSYELMDDGISTPWLAERTAKAKGLVGGGQLGYVMGIGNRVGISFEVGIRYAELNSDYPKQGNTATNYLYKNTIVYVPTLIGLRCQLGRGCSGY